jgi:DNA polymerase III subunit epsilon
MRLRELPVLVIDCQASSGDPAKGHLLELAWSVVRPSSPEPPSVEARLARMPEGETLPARIQRITGLDEEDVSRGEPPETIYTELDEVARSLARECGLPRCPAVVHFSSFEERYLRSLRYRTHRDSDLPFLFVCTHRVSRRLLPELPQRSLRAVAGYFGHGVAELRRAADHVSATIEVWRHFVELLARKDVEELGDFLNWLGSPSESPRASVRRYPMPRTAWQDLPRKPGVYRMLRANGDVLYVGKASSLRERVTSYFRSSANHAAHILEMLAQARDIETTVTGSALEAALLETEEIHRREPPYNRALRPRDRRLLYGDRSLRDFTDAPDRDHPEGPLPQSDVWPRLAAIRAGEGEEWFDCDRWTFLEGLAIFREAVGGASLLAHGAKEWLREPVEEDRSELKLTTAARGLHPPPTAAEIAGTMNVVVIRASHLVRRSRWLRTLSDSALVWRDADGARLALVFERGRLVSRLALEVDAPAPQPAGEPRERLSHPQALDLLSYDRLVVLTTEIRRLVSEERRVDLHLGSTQVVGPTRLAAMLRWI